MKNSSNEQRRLSELSNSDFTPAKGEPDIRGWIVTNNQGNKLGEVAELLIDSDAGKVRYLVLDLKNNEINLSSHQVIIPIGLAELDTTKDKVILPRISVDQLRLLPSYDKTNLSRETEIVVQQALTLNNFGTEMVTANQKSHEPGQDFYSHANYQAANLYKTRKAQTVIGLFNTVPSAQTAVKQLEQANIRRDKIEMVTRYAPKQADLVKVDNTPNAYEQFFTSLFASPADAQANLAVARKSNAIVAVYTTTPEETRAASQILQENNTEDINKSALPATPTANREHTGEPVRANTSGTNDILNAAADDQALNSDKNTVRTPQDRNHIVDRPLGEPIRRREKRGEHLIGNPTNGEANFTNFQPGIIELKEYTEVPIIRKEARVVEEVSIQKLVEEHNGIIQESVRHTEVDIQNRNNLDSAINP